MRERIFPIIIALSALSVSASAAFYSVFGLSHLFAGASTQVIIMAGTLEVAKLVVASLLYQYWDKLNKLLRTYFVIACFVLMVITSGGIYGYLSGAYQTTSTQSEFLDKQVAVIEQKQVRFEEQKTDLKNEKAALVKTISDLRVAISNPGQTQYVDKTSGQIITSTSNTGRKALQKELKTSITERDNIDVQLSTITDSIAALDVSILNAQINNESARELGPLKYMAELTGQSMATIVNWFMMLIIFVFDPLAIGMIIAANMAFANIKGIARDPKDYEVYQPEVIIKEVPVEKVEEEIIKEDYLNSYKSPSKYIMGVSWKWKNCKIVGFLISYICICEYTIIKRYGKRQFKVNKCKNS
jgi:chaperonin cofactor prefoldin